MINNITIFNLLNFMPLNDKEKKLFDFDKNIINRFNHNLDKGSFYLGGQIKMTHNDFINLDSIEKVRMINRQRISDYEGSCNSWEEASIYTSQKELELMESMIKSYIIIMEIREKEKN